MWAEAGCALYIYASCLGLNDNGVLQQGGMATNVSGAHTSTDGSITIIGFNNGWTSNVIGGVQVTGGTLTLGNFTDATGNQGVALNGDPEVIDAVLNVANMTTAQVDGIVANGSGISSINIIGALNNTASTIDLGGGEGPAWSLGSGGQISGGMITDGTLTVNGGGASLAGGVTLGADAILAITAPGATCTAIGNLIINGTVQIGDEANPGQFNWDAGQSTATWGGSGQLIFGNDGSSINDVSAQTGEGNSGLLFGDGGG